MQLVAERPTTDTIRARMNYIVDTGTPPVRYIDWPEMEHAEVPPQYELHDMTIRNGRPLRDIFNLDTHGFAFADQVKHHHRVRQQNHERREDAKGDKARDVAAAQAEDDGRGHANQADADG